MTQGFRPLTVEDKQDQKIAVHRLAERVGGQDAAGCRDPLLLSLHSPPASPRLSRRCTRPTNSKRCPESDRPLGPRSSPTRRPSTDMERTPSIRTDNMSASYSRRSPEIAGLIAAPQAQANWEPHARLLGLFHS